MYKKWILQFHAPEAHLQRTEERIIQSKTKTVSLVMWPTASNKKLKTKMEHKIFSESTVKPPQLIIIHMLALLSWPFCHFNL